MIAMNKKLMILGASELQIPAIKCANEMGISTVVLDYDPDAPGRKLASKFYEISTLDYDKVLKTAIKEGIDGIMTICSDRPMPVIAKVGEQLKLNTISYETAMDATDKGLMRKVLKKGNVPIPIFFICNNYYDFMQSVEKIFEISEKCIVKPSNNSGSRGIHILNKKDENLKEIYEYSSSFSTNGIVLVEEYMEGPEVSVEIFVVNGNPNVIQITDKITTGEPYFVELGHIQPSQLSKEIQSNIKEVAIKAVIELGIDKGPAHVEIKITPSGAKIVEVGARLGGDHITTDLVFLSTGVNMVNATIRCALNLDFDLEYQFEKCAMIRYFECKEGILKNIYGLDEIKNKINGIAEINITKKISERVTEIRNSNDRVGYVILFAQDYSSVLKMYEKIMSEIKIEVDEL